MPKGYQGGRTDYRYISSQVGDIAPDPCWDGDEDTSNSRTFDELDFAGNFKNVTDHPTSLGLDRDDR